MPTYYVDATAGDDNNDGLSSAAPWQTIEKVNAAELNPGDEVLFKRGETWADRLDVTASGESGNPIRFADYGSGARPVIDGEDSVVPITASEQDYLEFENLVCTQGHSAGMQFTTCSYVDVINCDCHDHGNDGILFITACHHCNVIGGSFYNGYSNIPTALISGLEVTNGGHDITFRDIKCYSNGDGGCGITIHSHPGETMPYNITIENAECYSNDGHGIQVLKQDDTADTDRSIVIKESTFRDNTETGIRIHKTAEAANYPDGITVDRCIVTGNTTYALYCQGDNVTIKHSVFADNQSKFHAAQDVTVYHCTFHNAVTETATLYWGEARSQNFTMKNCIVQCDVAAQLICAILTGCGVTGWDVDYNLYRRSAGTETSTHWHRLGTAYNFADWKTQTSGDANSDYGDAAFVDAANDNYRPQSSSPAVGAGTDVGLPYAGSAPDMGALEYLTQPGVGGSCFPGPMI
jgi:hypothetical protein